MRRFLLVAALLAAVAAASLVVTRDDAPTPRSSAAIHDVPVVPLERATAPVAVVAPVPAMPAALARLLEPLMANNGDPEARQELSIETYHDLIAAFADPEMLRAIEQMLTTADASNPEARVAVGALVGAGTAEAQAALLRLLDARAGDVDFMRLLVPSLGFTVNPSRDVEAALRGVANHAEQPLVRSMANLAMGTMAAGLAKADAARTAHIVDEYRGRLAHAVDAEQIRSNLSVLGNTRSPELVRAVGPFVTDARADVRASALESLRNVPAPEADDLLLRAVRDDRETDVRASAAWALSFRAPSQASVEAQAAALAGERSERVAKALLENLWVAAGTHHDAVLAAVSSTADQHPLPAIRELARSLLSNPPA